MVTSGSTLASAGALGALIAYVIAGISIFFVVNSLGEMATIIPITGSFNAYAARFVDPALVMLELTLRVLLAAGYIG